VHAGAQVPSLGAVGEYTVLHFDTGVRTGAYLLPMEPRISILGASLRLPFRIGVVWSIGLLSSVSLAPAHPGWLDWYIGMPSPFLEIGTKDTVFTIRTDQRYALGLPGGALDRGWIMRRVPYADGSDGYDSTTPVMLGVTFKW